MLVITASQNWGLRNQYPPFADFFILRIHEVTPVWGDFMFSVRFRHRVRVRVRRRRRRNDFCFSRQNFWAKP